MAVSFTALAGWHDAFHEILDHLEPLDDYQDDDEDETYNNPAGEVEDHSEVVKESSSIKLEVIPSSPPNSPNIQVEEYGTLHPRASFHHLT